MKSSLVCVAQRGSFMVRLAQRCSFEQACDSCEKLVRCDGLREVNLETCHQRARAVFSFGVSGERDGRNALDEARAALRFEAAKVAQHRVAVFLRQTDVAEEKIRPLRSIDRVEPCEQRAAR